jgi:hypothetical protein
MIKNNKEIGVACDFEKEIFEIQEKLKEFNFMVQKLQNDFKEKLQPIIEQQLFQEKMKLLYGKAIEGEIPHAHNDRKKDDSIVFNAFVAKKIKKREKMQV